MTGSAVLIIGSIVSATGKSIPQMIAGGAIFGAGSGFLEMSFGAVQVSYSYSVNAPYHYSRLILSTGNRSKRMALVLCRNI